MSVKWWGETQRNKRNNAGNYEGFTDFRFALPKATPSTGLGAKVRVVALRCESWESARVLYCRTDLYVAVRCGD